MSITPKHVACVGSRAITASEENLLQCIGEQLVRSGWTVHSGGAQGADQAFAKGAARALAARASGGLVIHLPWVSYERAAANSAVALSAGRAELDTVPFTADERALALSEHPAPDRLTAGGVTLMTRNVRIIFPAGLAAPPVQLVVALPSNKPGGGGTGHALRLATRFQIAIHDLRSPNLLKQYTDRLAMVSPLSPASSFPKL